MASMRRRALLCLLLWMAGLGTAQAERRQRPRLNLPSGWTWPPSKETREHGRACLDDLRTLDIEFRQPRRKRSRHRYIATPVIVPSMEFGPIRLTPTYRKGPFVMDCRLARSIAQTAPGLAALGIRELRFSSIHHVRRVRLGGKELGSMSRHALGLAIDVFAVELADERRIVVEDNYWCCLPIVPVAEAYLRLAGVYRAILSPAVDPASHYDHLHLEARVERSDRRMARKARKAREARKARKARKARQARKAKKRARVAKARRARKDREQRKRRRERD